MFTAEQLEFATAVERFCADGCGTVEQRAQLTQGLSNSSELLHRHAELGWLGVSIPTGFGGGTGPTATQTLRKALAPLIYGGTNEIQREISGKSLGL